MKAADITKLSSMPLASPSYPRGPSFVLYEFIRMPVSADHKVAR
jgi:acetoacetate decarboxylase